MAIAADDGHAARCQRRALRGRNSNRAEDATFGKMVKDFGIRFVQAVCVEQLPGARLLFPTPFLRLALLVQPPVPLALAGGIGRSLLANFGLARRVLGGHLTLLTLVTLLAGIRLQLFGPLRRDQPRFHEFIAQRHRRFLRTGASIQDPGSNRSGNRFQPFLQR